MVTTLDLRAPCTYCGETLESLGQCAKCGERAFTHVELNGPDQEQNARSSERIWHCQAHRCDAGGHVYQWRGTRP